MPMSPRLALALTIPVSAAVAYFTVRASTPSGGDARSPAPGAPAARVEGRGERAAAGRGTPADDGAVLRRLEALEARFASEGSRTPDGKPAGGAAASAHPEAAAGAPTARVHQEVTVAVNAEPSSSEHRAAVRRLAELLVESVGPPFVERESTFAVGKLDRETHRYRISPEEAADLAPFLPGLPVGHAARPAIARAVALGWGGDARLGGFLSQFAVNTEPGLHQGILETLDDEHPGPAFSEYLVRLVREERDPSVLAGAFGLDRIEAAATAAFAPQLVQAIEVRVLDGSLDADTRTRAGLAIAIAGLRAPDAAVAALRRVAEAEADPKVADRYRGAIAAIQAGDATLKSLERLFE